MLHISLLLLPHRKNLYLLLSNIVLFELFMTSTEKQIHSHLILSTFWEFVLKL